MTKNYYSTLSDLVNSFINDEDASTCINALVDSFNSFYEALVDVCGVEEADKKMDEVKKPNTACECHKCNCHSNDDINDTTDIKNDEEPAPASIANKIKAYYIKKDAADKVSKENINTVYEYIMSNLDLYEDNDLLEYCNDILKMNISDRAIVALYNSLDADEKCDLINKLLGSTGFSAISFETYQKSDLYVVFKF